MRWNRTPQWPNVSDSKSKVRCSRFQRVTQPWPNPAALCTRAICCGAPLRSASRPRVSQHFARRRVGDEHTGVRRQPVHPDGCELERRPQGLRASGHAPCFHFYQASGDSRAARVIAGAGATEISAWRICEGARSMHIIFARAQQPQGKYGRSPRALSLRNFALLFLSTVHLQ